MTGDSIDLKQLLSVAATGQALTDDQAQTAFGIMMSGDATPSQMGAFLMALRVRGETVSEITGAVRAMRAKMLTIEAPEGAIDVCGTGGDATGTYNISTASQFVLAGCGVPVAKHGNRALSSKAGSADVMSALGVNIEAGMELVKESLWRNNIGFLMAPRHHSAMRHVAPTRVELGTRTIFNLLGPLSNPANARRQLLGVFHRQWIEPMAEVLGSLGSERAWVVHGSDGLDELTTTGASYVAELNDGMVSTFEVRPEDAGLSRASPGDLKGNDANTNASAMRAMLDGEPGPFRDIVLYNTAGALIVAGVAEGLKDGVALGAEALDSGKAGAVLDRLVEITNRKAANG